MDFSWTDALPIGILMFLGTLFGFARRRAGRALAQRGFPALAEKLGLQFEAPRYRGWAGRLKGELRGHEVLVQSEERARIVVYLGRQPPIELRSYAHYKRTPDGFASFSLGERKLDRWLPNRYCGVGAEDELAGNETLATTLSELSTMTDHLKQLTVEPQRIEAVLDYGSPPYIPTADAERLLRLLVDLATEIEACFERSMSAGRGAVTHSERTSEAAPDSLA